MDCEISDLLNRHGRRLDIMSGMLYRVKALGKSIKQTL
jgi:hypothetical protein